MRPRFKYGNRKIETPEGIYDSRLEYRRGLILKEAEKIGWISNLRRQVEYLLIPTQYRTETVQLKTKTKEVRRVAERQVVYTADFVYEKDGQTVVEDCKGLRLADYVLRRKMMLYFHGITVREVKRATEEI